MDNAGAGKAEVDNNTNLTNAQPPASSSAQPEGSQASSVQARTPEGRPRHQVQISDEEAISQMSEEARSVLSSDIDKMNEDNLYKLVDQLRNLIISVKDMRTQLITEVKELRERRRNLIDQKRGLSDQLAKLREQRKSLLDELVRLKQERDSLLKEFRSKVEQLKEARQLLDKESSIAKVSLRKIQKRIEELEWRQQTSVLSQQEEKRLVEEIQRLEELAERVRKARQEEVSIMELEAEVKSLRMRLAEVNSKLDGIRNTIGNLKSQMASLIPKIDELDKQVNSLKEVIDLKSHTIDVYTKQLDLLYDKYRKIMVRLRELKVSKRRGLEVTLIEEKRKQIEERLKRGEALSLDEMRVLYGEFDF